MPCNRPDITLAWVGLFFAAGLGAACSGCDSKQQDVAISSQPNEAKPTATPTTNTPSNPVTVATAPEISPPGQPSPPKPKLKPGAKTKVLARAGDTSYDKTFDDIRFDIEPGQPFHRKMLTAEIEAMAGQKIRIRGYILPTAQKRGFKQFVLVRDNQECCFGPGAALYDCILVELKPGATAEFSIRPVAVEGTFDIREFIGPDGKHLAIYHLDGQSVQ